jgi:hypothetical protein
MAELKFGVTLPYGDPQLAAALARAAEDAGWDGVFVGDAVWCQDPLIQLAAAACATSRIRLGTMVLAAPLRQPRHLASESVALDRLSQGRLILGLATGATWMGWQGFPDEVTGTRARAEMLDEMIDILTRLHQREQFDYDGKHYRVRLSQVDPQHYPPAPLQQPRVPIWIPGVWPRMKSMQRVLKCDGLLPAKMNAEGKFEDVTPDDVRAMKAYIDAHRTLTTPFDIVVEGKTAGLSAAEKQEKLDAWQAAGITWWVESLWGSSEEETRAIIHQGPPKP